MFVSSVVAKRNREDGFLGTMHLNALNGCSDSDDASDYHPFGGLFGVSLSEGHPYMPHDSGRTFHDSRSSFKRSDSQNLSQGACSSNTTSVSCHLNSSSTSSPREFDLQSARSSFVGHSDRGDFSFPKTRFSPFVDTDASYSSSSSKLSARNGHGHTSYKHLPYINTASSFDNRMTSSNTRMTSPTQSVKKCLQSHRSSPGERRRHSLDLDELQIPATPGLHESSLSSEELTSGTSLGKMPSRHAKHAQGNGEELPDLRRLDINEVRIGLLLVF